MKYPKKLSCCSLQHRKDIPRRHFVTYFKLRSLEKSNPQNTLCLHFSIAFLSWPICHNLCMLAAKVKWAEQLTFLLQQSAKVSIPKHALIHNVEITTTQEIITCKFFFPFSEIFLGKGEVAATGQIAAICSNQDILGYLNVFCRQLHQLSVPIILNCYDQSYNQMIQ